MRETWYDLIVKEIDWSRETDLHIKTVIQKCNHSQINCPVCAPPAAIHRNKWGKVFELCLKSFLKSVKLSVFLVYIWQYL